ncbi:MAG: hypothetical protein OEY38_05900, partial [Gammaproteobacteria bacterium]|nr:hypothetical protein [Gammaproteobacteria bacterium]
YTWDEFLTLVPRLKALQHIRLQYPHYPSREIESRVVYVALSATSVGTKFREMVDPWMEQAEMLLQPGENPPYRIQLNVSLGLCYTLKGQHTKANIIFTELMDNAESERESIITRLHIYVMHAFSLWLAGRYYDAKPMAKKGLQLSQTHGVSVYDIVLHDGLIYSCGMLGELRDAELSVIAIRRLLTKIPQRLDRGYNNYQAGWVAMLQADHARAFEHIRKSHEIISDACDSFALAWVNIAMAYFLAEQQQYEEAEYKLAQAFDYAHSFQAKQVEFSCWLFKARIETKQGNHENGVYALQKALALGRDHNFLVSIFMLPDILTELCVTALENKIEEDYVSKLINHNNLTPESPPVHLENWPWKLKIYVKNQFKAVVEQKEISLSGKTRKLMEILIDCQGRNVDEGKIKDILWPHAEGDKADQNFKTTLHRTRKVIGNETITLKNGKVSLNKNKCWVDVW